MPLAMYGIIFQTTLPSLHIINLILLFNSVSLLGIKWYATVDFNFFK